MKAGIIAPLGIAAVNGGVRTQATQTAVHLQALGVNTTFVSPWDTDLDIDIAHVFIAGPDNLGIIRRLKELGIPVVLSPVLFSNRSARLISLSLKAEKLLGFLGSGIRSEFGIKAEVCSLADLLLPNTMAEAHLIEQGFGVSTEKMIIVPNGVESRFKEADPALFTHTYGIKEFVLFTGQAGAPRKNIKGLLLAAKNIHAEIVIIGSLYDDAYGTECKKLAQDSGNVTFIETLEHDSEMLASAYAACHTFVLPSYFETPGIAAMEAALAGANIAITQKGGTKDYFRDHAEYLNPDSVESIADTINRSLGKEKDPLLAEYISERFGWDKVAEQTLKTYRKLIR